MSVAQNVTGSVNLSVALQQVGTLGAQLNTTAQQQFNQAIQYVNNTGVNFGVDQLFGATGSLASTTVSFHFQDGTASDIFGHALAMLRIRLLLVVNLNTTLSQDLKLEAAGTHGIAWIPTSAAPLLVRSGTTNQPGVYLNSDPASFGGSVGNVIDSTHDGITLDSGSNTVAYAVICLGCSVA